VALQLRQLGFPKAFALDGGFDAWKDADLPLEALTSRGARPKSDAHQPM
jgi:3-mercaptopyruvate sulfurtransferase SseA